MAGCTDPGCIWGVTPSPSRASPLRTGTPAELFPSPGPSWATSWRILFTQAFVTKQHQGLVSEAPEPQKRSPFFKKKTRDIFVYKTFILPNKKLKYWTMWVRCLAREKRSEGNVPRAGHARGSVSLPQSPDFW